ncbi:patatin-like protein 6 isoform X1 [Salvia miltiorrhiza]|uniref:patatin-like protein 6 isoform X1 n=1 Tax=Salvia miltiorrhiza TaxID=226208 RepID=UPI0025AD8E1B|nr:patatin-like protein 6 isoform X1 [Salvia miltiorrhiza]XP_057799053.1 patatin-like protein 6 isoform X1 [Salvia miltiorrhiza]XP_057799054.1 patatin-like protein 6 isoform X1 [Salvia miltiorrhiza]
MACVDVNDDRSINPMIGLQEPSIDTDKLSYEIFSILESKFLFGYDDQQLWVQKPIAVQPKSAVVPGIDDGGVQVAKNQRGKICILSIDGAGMRSILSGKTLAYLETALKNKSGNPDARIADYFDVAAGTGVGGIFTAMLFAAGDQNRPIFHADDTWKFLAAEGKKVYSLARTRSSRNGFLKRVFKKSGSGGGGSSTAGMEKAMKEAFKDERTGRSLTLKDTLKPVLIPCYDLSSAAPFLFSRADALESDSFDFNLWEVCLATAAEPVVFDPVCMKSVDGLTRCVGLDGGLAMSNPTAAAITHVLHNKQEFPFVRGVEDILVLSVGAGGQLMEGSFDYEQVKTWKAKDWARPLARISGDSAAEMVDHAVAMAFGQSRSSNYVRVQASCSSFGQCSANVDSDPSPSNVKMLMGIADEMLKQKNVESVLFSGKKIGEQSNLEKLDWFADQLVLEHQKRSCRIAPTVAFKQPSRP